MSRRVSHRPDPHEEAWRAGLGLLQAHGLFRSFDRVVWTESGRLTQDRGYGHVDMNGFVYCRKDANLDPDEWAWVVAHLLLHRGLGHLRPDRRRDTAQSTVDCLEVDRFLREAKIGREPVPLPAELPRGESTTLAARWRDEGVPVELVHIGAAGFGPDVVDAGGPVQSLRLGGRSPTTAAVAPTCSPGSRSSSGPQCDVFRVRREHALLVPEAARLPFTPRGPVFHIS